MTPPDLIDRTAALISVYGLVQGVGFRPFVYRLANLHKLFGWVRNDGTCVMIHVEGMQDAIQRFLCQLRSHAPADAQIERVQVLKCSPNNYASFSIDQSRQAHLVSTRVPVDLATCEICRDELFDPTNRRYRHAFVNCTACGPRYTIVEAMPYDRVRTIMRQFELCSDCQSEYNDPSDRRYHAQPIACPQCGPRLSAHLADCETRFDEEALSLAIEVLRSGRILALKGLGGFQLLVRADDSAAVRRLRIRKQRPSKPFAVMVASLSMAHQCADISTFEESILVHSSNPIVLLQRSATAPLATDVAPAIGTIGLFLPTTPIHHLLLSELNCPVVATSGNRSGEPLAVDLTEAKNRLELIAECFLDHNRPIRRRVDDSVVRCVSGRPMAIRLARGFVPRPLPCLERWAFEHRLPAVLAVGGQQKVALACWSGQQAVLGPHIGDLNDCSTLAVFESGIRELSELMRCKPEAIVSDLHPDYESTRWAERSGLPMIRVQHHHAHAAAVMAEHDLLSQEVLALIWDGTGFGDDGTLWGGEALRVTLTDYQRVGFLKPIPLPGGEAAITEPARIALALVSEARGFERCLADKPLLDRLGLSQARAKSLLWMIERKINCPISSGLGRLIDGLAALVLPLPRVSYDAEAAVRLESLCEDISAAPYPMPLICTNGMWCADWRPFVNLVLEDLERNIARRVVAVKIHLTIANLAEQLASCVPRLPIVLSGGCFQNRWLTEWVMSRLTAAGRMVYSAEWIPANDGGLSVGQLAIALGHLSCGKN